ncbi:hypothetical protein AKJ09_03961 [Labilithrix luteola]|uniref:Putative auto-transporter adhesin head GIN domain-containing protein n=1 Tax=Labilithrix luteola TaxID=1391654 RepID=A0A0K1PUV2_9BACT|nr:hypothetical protein AKJ09_03961 [Labilithrix luteola]
MFSCSVALVGCGDGSLDGSGVLVTDQRAVTEFHALSITENLVAEIGVGPSSVTLEMDDNLVKRVAAHVEDGVLVLERGDGEPELRPTNNARIRITTPHLDDISASGATTVLAKSASPAVAISATGRSHVSIAGAAVVVSISATGASDVDSQVPATRADVTTTGTSRVRVRVSERLAATATGASQITVLGEPAAREIVTTGRADVLFSE